MGYGVPAAVAAKALAPGPRPSVCFAGDGDFLMIGQELATAVQYELPIVVLVVDNGMYGTIRMHQERHFPGRVVGTDLVNPDFAAFARSFGAHGETVERTDEFPAALERALARGRAGGDRAAHRPGGDHAADDAQRDPGGRRMSGREEIRVPELAEPISHYTDAVRAATCSSSRAACRSTATGKLVPGDVVAQARQVFANIDAVLAAAGASFADVVKVTVFLIDVDDRRGGQRRAAGGLRRDAAREHARRGQPRSRFRARASRSRRSR